MELMINLKKFSNYYSYIVLGINSGNVLINQKLADLRAIGVTILYSFLLGIFEKLDQNELNEQEVVDILEALIIYFLRRRIMKLTQGENKTFPSLIKKINILIDATDKKQKMFEILAQQENAVRLPNDIELANELKTMNFYNFNQSKFLLSLVEEKLTKSRPNKDDKHLQIEHIMPQTLNETWEKSLGVDFESVHQEFINNIGNLTLIRHNQELGNKPFHDKKVVYENHAGLQIAKTEIVNRTNWNKNSIQNRNKWIVDYILKEVLPIPEEMRRKNNYNQKKSKSKRLSFNDLQLINQSINYISDKDIRVKVVNDREVEFEGKNWKLSPLTREIETRKGTVNTSGAYQGAQYWEFEGIKLVDIM